MQTFREIEKQEPGERVVLTPHIRALAEGSASEAEATFETFWEAFCQAMKWEIIRRGLWQRAPRYLGLTDSPRWNAEVLEELSSDAYIFLLERLRGLSAQCRVHSNIDPLIYRNLRLFLFERQKACDPLGFRVFEVVRAATRLAIDEGNLIVVDGDIKVDNRTTLQGSRSWSSESASPGRGPALNWTEDPLAQELDERASRWSDELLPEWLVARGPAYQKVVIKLADHFAELTDGVARPLAFKVLVDACKRAVRARWKAIWRNETTNVGDWEEEESVVILSRQLVPPGSSFEARQSYERLVARVDERILQVEASAITHSHLLALWEYLRIAASLDETALPSRRQIASRLGLPRYRMPFLFKTLSSVVTSSQEELSRSRQPQGDKV